MRFRVKVTLCMLSVLSTLFGVGGSLLISEAFQDTLKREKDAAFSAYQMVWGSLQIVNSLDHRLDQEGIASVMQQLHDQNQNAWAALRLTDEKMVLFESEAAGLYFPSAMDLPEADQCQFRIAEGENGDKYFILSGAVKAGEDITLYLYTAHDVSGVFAMRQVQQATYLRAFSAMMVLCAGLSYTVSRVLTAPLARLSKASRAIASGNYASRVPVRSEDEIGAVSADFNAMAAQMEKTVSQLCRAVERQERFVGSFAHEMKTPMTSLIGYAELLRSETLTPEEQAEASGYIYSEGKRLENLSRKLLELLSLKQSRLPLAEICPADLIEEFTERIRPLYAAQNISLTRSTDARDGTCLLEPDLVWTLLLNLSDNARKAIEGEGYIHYRLEILPDGCRITVQDNGRGIPKASLEHLTEAFYRVDKARSRAQGGYGLGLALCQEIVDFHHGSIRFSNRSGGGASVTVELKGGRP